MTSSHDIVKLKAQSFKCLCGHHITELVTFLSHDSPLPFHQASMVVRMLV